MKKFIIISVLFGLVFSIQANALAVIDQEALEKKFEEFDHVFTDLEAEAAELEVTDSISVEYNISSVKMLPSSNAYFLKTWWEKIKLFFTFDKQEKVNKLMDSSDKRLAEAEKMLNEGEDAEMVFETINNYQTNTGEALELYEKFDETTSAFGEVLGDLTERLVGQQEFIEDLKEKFPEDYQDKIDKGNETINEFIEDNIE